MANNDTIIAYPNDGDTLQADVTTNNINAILARMENGDSVTTTQLTTLINNVKATAETALSAANSANSNSVKLSGNQTIAGNKTFTGTVKVPASKTAGTAISLVGVSDNGLSLGTGTKINWGIVEISGDSYKDYTFKYPFSNQNSYSVVVSAIETGDIAWSPAVYRRSGAVVRIYANDRRVLLIAIGK